MRMMKMRMMMRMNTPAVFLFLFITTALLSQTQAFPTAAVDEAEYDRQLTEERPLQQQIADSESQTDPKPTQASEFGPDADDVMLLKSLAEKSGTDSAHKHSNSAHNQSDSAHNHGDSAYHHGDSAHDREDATKSRRRADDYDTTKNANNIKYRDDSERLQQLDVTPLTAEDIVQKIANKIYEEDDRGVFDRIVSKLLKLGLITESQADTLEVEVAEALQDLITKNAKNNEIQELNNNNNNRDEEERRSRFDDDDANDDGHDDDVTDDDGGDDDDDGDEEQKEEIRDAGGNWDGVSEGNDRNEVNPEDELQDLQYFPNFYRLLKSLDSEQDAEERETLITIMKTLIDFVKMMVKYGTITPEEGVSYLENLDNMIATQTRNKLGKALGPISTKPPTGPTDEDDNTKEETAKMLREYENLKDSTKEERTPAENGHAGKSESYLEAIRKNIEWLKKHDKDQNKEDYDLSKLRDFMDQQVDTYLQKGILKQDEGDVIKRIYGSL